MKIFKNQKKLSISKTIRNFKDKITFKKSIKEIFSKWLLLFFSCLVYSIIMTAMISSSLAFWKMNLIIFSISSAVYTPIIILATGAELIERHIANKKASKEIDSIVETINQNDIDLTKEEINDKVDVCEMENSKGYAYLDNGDYKKCKKVVSYISINNKDKYKIIKEVTTYIRKVFYKKHSNNAYIMNEQDLVAEGFIDEKGKVTEKGKLLNLKMN